jgi:type IV secretory pathway VirB10-like protein
MKRILVIALLISLPAVAKKKHPAKPVAKPVEAAQPAAPENLPALAPKEEPPPPPPPVAETPPAPAPPPKEEPPPKPDKVSIDLEALSNEYHQLRDELFRSRAKAEMVGKSLYKTRLVATFQYRAQRAWPLKKVTLKLDDQPVADQDSPNASDDPIKIFEGFVAPGRHRLSLRVECGATGDPNQSYTAEGAFVVETVDGKQARVKLSVDETGDGPQALAKNKSGSFDVRVRGDVATLKLDEK